MHSVGIVFDKSFTINIGGTALRKLPLDVPQENIGTSCIAAGILALPFPLASGALSRMLDAKKDRQRSYVCPGSVLLSRQSKL